MATYGVVPTGFSRKPLTQILSEIETAAVGVFGAGVVQTAQSPLGQLNGLMADIVSTAWEIALATYQSYDPDEAEGVNLERLGRLRLLERATAELDADFRQAITNAGRARIDVQDLDRAVRALSGVTYVRVYINDSDSIDPATGVLPHQLAIAVLGGDDATVAGTARDYVVPGIGTFGNVSVDTLAEGFCRTVRLVRPTEIQVSLTVSVRVRYDRNGCPPPSPGTIAIGVAQALSGAGRPDNGQDVTDHLIRSTVESLYPNAEFISATAAVGTAQQFPLPLPIGFFEIAQFDASRVTVTIVA